MERKSWFLAPSTCEFDVCHQVWQRRIKERLNSLCAEWCKKGTKTELRGSGDRQRRREWEEKRWTEICQTLRESPNAGSSDNPALCYAALLTGKIDGGRLIDRGSVIWNPAQVKMGGVKKDKTKGKRWVAATAGLALFVMLQRFIRGSNKVR